MERNSPEPRPSAGNRRRLALRLALLALLIAIAVAGLFIDAQGLFETLRARRVAIEGWVEANYLLAVALYVGGYIAMAAFSVPGAVWLTIAGGFLFGLLPAAAYTIVGATTGALGAFLAARFIVGDALRRRAGTFVRRMEKGFRRHAFNYMLVLRMIPVFPFWVVNFVPALLGVPLRTYALGTLLGIIPGTLVFAGIGSGLAGVFAEGRKVDPGIILEPSILAPLVGLAVLALLPIAAARFFQRGGKDDG